MDFSELPFSTLYERPSRLSNRGCCYSDEELRGFLAMRDEELRWQEYQALFDIARCTGTYEELVYFLPYAFRYVLSDDPEAHECSSQIIHFVSRENEKLEADDLRGPCRQALASWFQRWTSTFVVEHLAEPCTMFGRRLDHHDHVVNSDLVVGLIDDLLTYRVHADLAESLVHSTSSHQGNTVQSAWFLEYAKEVRENHRFFLASGEHEQAVRGLVPGFLQEAMDELRIESGPLPEGLGPLVLQTLLGMVGNGERMVPAAKSKAIWGSITSDTLLRCRWESIRKTPVVTQSHQSYWLDLCEFLGMGVG